MTVAAAVLIGALVLLLGRDQVLLDSAAGVLLVGGGLLAAVLASLAWRQERDRSQATLGAAREAAARAREFTARLNEGLGQLHQGHTMLEDPADTRVAVLRLAVSLVEAEKGLLLGRDDADGDGNLDVVCALGFEHDPEPSLLVQRLGGRVLDRDETLRDDAPVPDGKGADGEIENLVAIPIYIRDEFDGVVVCANRAGGFADIDDEVLLALGNHASSVLGGTKLRGELRTAYVATVRALADAIAAKDPGVRSHSEDVAGYVTAVARRLELDATRREELLFGSLLHDVGKIGISERILLKPDRLTPDEYEAIKQHPQIGHRLVAGIPALAGIAAGILHHHERYDGTGYPTGLAGEAIPLEARIIGVADSFSAMTTSRPYSTGRSVEAACSELERCAGSQFDPHVVELFVAEVRAKPPAGRPNPLAEALTDPVLAPHRPSPGPALAVVDGLTALYARRHFEELAEARARVAGLRDAPFGVVVVEVTDLAERNRREGFAAGDQALQTVAAGLRRVEAATGATACRVGGGRFALLVDAPGEAALAAARERAQLELAGGPECRCHAVLWRAGEDGGALIARARAELAAV